MIEEAENAGLAERLIRQTCIKQAITPKEPRLLVDRGSRMISKTVAQLLAGLGINQSAANPTSPATVPSPRPRSRQPRTAPAT